MTIEQVRGIIESNKTNIAFVVGNGINRYFNQGQSWHDLLTMLWHSVTGESLREIPDGISTTEFYDALDLVAGPRSAKNAIRKQLQELLTVLEPSVRQRTVLAEIARQNVPVLTTNFDATISSALGLQLLPRKRGRGFTDIYPWECYYAWEPAPDPLRSFAVWHINGMLKYHRSIRLSLSHYTGSVNRARNWVGKLRDRRAFFADPAESIGSTHTWLDIFFRKDLFIVGLGLLENEVFLRWLLIQRARYSRNLDLPPRRGWFLKPESEVNDGRDFFFRTVGIQTIELPAYQDIYESLWARLS